MGVIFSKSESRTLIDGIKTNLNNAREVTQDLQIGCTHLVQAVDGHTLSGAAYQAGANLFSELILPTVERCADAISEMEEDLQTYIGADSAIQAASQDTLDEAKLEQKIHECEAHKNAMEATANALNSQAFEMMAMTNPVAAIVSIANQLFDLQGKLNSQAESLEQDIEKLKKDLRLLQDFSSQTQGMFSNSLDNIKIAMQGVLVLNGTTINQDGSYSLPKGVDKTWFSIIRNTGELQVLEEIEKNQAIKELNDLFTKNPVAAIEKVKNNERLFGYAISSIDKVPKRFQNAVLGLFIAQENWSVLPKKAATKLLNSRQFALYMKDLSLNQQIAVYNKLEKIEEKGWDVFAPIGYAVSVLSKDSAGAKVIASSKIGIKLMEKGKAVSAFLKAHPMAKESLSIAGDGLTIGSFAYDEYINPNSPAYGDVSKSLYGGQNRFLASIGPLEGGSIWICFRSFCGSIKLFWTRWRII